MGKLTWIISEEESQLSFRLKYFEMGHITGHILRFNGKVLANEFFDSPETYMFLDSGSIDTYQAQKNEIIKSKEILHTEQFPFMEFNSVDGCLLRSGSIWELTGYLMIKDVKQRLTLVVNYSHIDIRGKEGKAKFRLFGEISRQTFGLQCLEEGDYGDSVSIYADIILYAVIP